jgi:hypothetical protein
MKEPDLMMSGRDWWQISGQKVPEWLHSIGRVEFLQIDLQKKTVFRRVMGRLARSTNYGTIGKSIACSMGVIMKITFLYYEDCPSHDKALDRLRSIMAEEGVQTEIKIIKVETDEQAQALEFVGSPTIRVNGRDIDPPAPGAYYALTCRAYQLEDGRISPLPSAELIRRSLRTAL